MTEESDKCWYRIGSPPPPTSQNEVLKFRSVKSIVIAPASTGRERSSKTAVIKTDHGNIAIRSRRRPSTRRLTKVVMKLIAPRIEEAPAIWREKIAISTDAPAWEMFLARGG